MHAQDRTPRTPWIRFGVIAAFMAGMTACGGSSSLEARPPAAPPPTATPPVTSAAVTGVVVLRDDVAPGAPEAAGPPVAGWGKLADQTTFDRAFGNADWVIVGADGMRGATSEQGALHVTDLPPGKYTLQLTKTLGGNLVPLAIPFVVGDDGSATIVAEVGLGLVRTSLTYTKDGAEIREIHGPYGNRVILRDGQVVELGDASRVLTDSDGDGRFENPTCTQTAWSCGRDPSNLDCGMERVCQCVNACPDCKAPCVLPGVCVSPGAPPPYRCGADDTCSLPGDRCTCVSSCPACDDCSTRVCLPACAPVEIASISVTGPAQLVVGRRAQVYATAQLSDGSVFDVTYLADWQSSNEAIATVDSWGTVSAVAIGTTTLTASIGTVQSAPLPLAVVERPTLNAIHVQNQGCFCGPVLGRPEPVSDMFAPCRFAAPSADTLPVPSCNQVILIGATLQFTALGEFADGSYEDITKSVTWAVTPAAVGDLVNGVFTGRQAGMASITASLAGVSSDPTSVTVVTEATLESLSIYPGNAGGPIAIAVPGMAEDARPTPCFDCGVNVTVLRGDELQFQATAHYDTGEWRDVTKDVTWRTSDGAIATIDATGALQAVDGGAAVIDAELDDVTSNPVTVRVVNEATLQSLSVYQEGNDRVVAKADQRYFHASGYYDVGISREVTTEATWHSSDDAVGGFDTPGVFTARTAGQVQVWAELDGQRSNPLALEVFETSELTYCDPANINRGVWADAYNRVLLESDCATYTQPGVATVRYTVTETQPHGGVFDPCLDLYVFQGKEKIRTIREEGCGDPFLAMAAPGRDEAAVKYQLRAFWDLKDDRGVPVAPGHYTIYGRFYLYYDPVVGIDVTVQSGQPCTNETTCATGQHFERAICACVADATGCSRDTDCRLFSDYCMGCTCRALLRSDPDPTCDTPGVECFRDPCGDTQAVCRAGQCVASFGPTPVPNRGVIIQLGSASGAAGEAVAIDVSMQTGGTAIAGTENDIIFDPKALAVDHTDDGRPRCKVNPSINKPGTGFSFLPDGCQPGVDCDRIRALVVSLADLSPIADGAVLYSCALSIAAGVDSGSYALRCDGVIASTPEAGHAAVRCIDGSIQVGAMPPPPSSEIEGACYLGSSTCESATYDPTTQAKCCSLFRFGAGPAALSWCRREQLDPTTGKCMACASTPCDGLPPDQLG